MINPYNCFIFYGVIINKRKLHNLALQNKCVDMYDLLDKYELDHRIIGDVRVSSKIVIGKEIHWDYGTNVIELNMKNEQELSLTSLFETEEGNTKIENNLYKDYKNIRMKLKEIGTGKSPKTLILTSDG